MRRQTVSIELKGVGKVVGNETHIYPTDLRLEEGAFNVLLGTTLSGKTTLLRLMAGLEPPIKCDRDASSKTQCFHGLPAVY